MKPNRAPACLAAGAAILAAVVAASAPHSAHACSIAGLQREFLTYALEDSTIVAVGRLVDAKQTEITLEVDEGLKGSTRGDRLVLNNRHFGLGADCSVYVEPGSRGYALPEEARVIAFLQPDVSQRPDFWMPASYGYAIYKIVMEDQPFGADGWSQDGIVRLAAHRDALAPHAKVPFEPALEKIRPCTTVAFEPANAETLSRMSESIAVASVVQVDAMLATLRIEEVWRGTPGDTFTVNANHFHQENSCDLTPSGGPRFQEGERLLVLLFPDEFGVAQYRLANWGHGSLRLRGEWVSQGLPVLQDVRDLLASGIGTKAPPANSDRIKDGVLYPEFAKQFPGSPIHQGGDDEQQPSAHAEANGKDESGASPWPIALTGAAVMIAFAAGGGVLLIRRGRGR